MSFREESIWRQSVKQHPFCGWRFRGQVWVIARASGVVALLLLILWIDLLSEYNLSVSLDYLTFMLQNFTILHYSVGTTKSTWNIWMYNWFYTGTHFCLLQVWKQAFWACCPLSRLPVSQPLYRPHVCWDDKHDPDRIRLNVSPSGWSGCECVSV